MVCSLLLGGAASTTLVSCSDHDDDITNLNNTTADLSKQLGTLQEALKANEDAAKQADAAAKQALADAAKAAQSGDAAAAEAKKAVAEAELAKKAAADAKAEAIAEVIKQLEPLINGKADAAEVAKLAGRIDGIEKGLKNIDLTDINKQLGDQAQTIADQAKLIEALQVQTKALDKFKTDLETLGSRIDGIDLKISKIESTISDLNKLQSQVSTNASDIASIKKQLEGISGTVSQEINNSVNTIATVLSNRLTSVTLIPNAYVGGIPTIDFESAKYVKQKQDGLDWVDVTTGKYQFIVSNNQTEAQYRLNPASITSSDIDINNMAYVNRVATTRAGEILNDIVNVKSVAIEPTGGIMTVKLGKSNTESLNHPDANKINTVSLKVPVAKKHLFSGETEVSVYSEFSRVAETYFQPILALTAEKDAEADAQLYTAAQIYGYKTGQNANCAKEGKMVAKKIPFGESYNLYKLVEGCKFFADTKTSDPLSLSQLKEYGMAIVFDKGASYTLPFSTSGTEQQDFFKLSSWNNSVLTPTLSGGKPGNETIIGKQPIIRATLKDTVNNNVIEVRYFKVMFVKENMADKVVTWDNLTTTGIACQGANVNFTWKDFEGLLSQLNDEKGMSQDDFVEIYNQKPAIVTPANDDCGKLSADPMSALRDAALPVMTWTFTPAQLVAYDTDGKLQEGVNKTKVIKKSIKFVPKDDLHRAIVINLELVITTEVGNVTLGKTNGLKWDSNNTMKVYPTPMPTDYTIESKVKATYNTNILEGREKPYTTGLTSCAKYDINYKNAMVPGGCKQLILPAGYNHWSFNRDNQNDVNAIYFQLIKGNAAAEKLAAGKGEDIVINWSNDINGNTANRYVFGSMKLHVVKILNLETTLADAFVDNSRAQTINIKDEFKMTDAYGNAVKYYAEPSGDAEILANKYYHYYGVNEAKFGADATMPNDAIVKEIVICNSADGKGQQWTPASLNMSANFNAATGDLTFQNNGAPLQANAYVLVPISVKHEWGTLTGHIAVPLNKSNAPLSKRRK